MSSLALTPTIPAHAGTMHWLADWRRHEPRFFRLGALLALLMIPTAFALAVDPRTFLDINVWDKPLKFEVALAIYILTLAFFARWLPAGLTGKPWYRIYAGLLVAAIVVEMIWIGGAAAMAIPSHFNLTPIGSAIYQFMGASAVLLTSASTVYALQIARNPRTGLSPVVKESIVVGLALVLPLTLVTAGTMSGMGGPWVGGAQSDAGGLMLMGWARDGGDLRVARFFATHSMHWIPAFGFVSAQIWGGEYRLPTRIFSGLFLALVAYAFAEALSGRPFLPMLG